MAATNKERSYTTSYTQDNSLIYMRIYMESYIKDGKSRLRLRRMDDDKIVGDYLNKDFVKIAVRMNNKWHKKGYHPVWVLDGKH